MDDWLTIAETAAELGCSERTVRRHVASKKLSGVIRAGVRFIPKYEVQALKSLREGDDDSVRPSHEQVTDSTRCLLVAASELATIL